jgi:sialidase-1
MLLGLCAGPAPPAPPAFEQVDLFRAGEGGVHTYRIPALVQTRTGVLIAVADARRKSDRDLPNDIALVIRRSLDGGKTWSPIRTLREVEAGGVGDASLLLDRKTGRVWCFHAYGAPGIGTFESKPGTTTGPATMQLHGIYSDDEGAAWSAPQDLTPRFKDPRWMGLFVTSGTNIQTSKGRYLLPLVVRDAGGKLTSRNIYSDDGGVNWTVGAVIETGTDESHNVELGDGTILQNMRNGTRRAIARSSDGGATFGPVEHDAALIDPSCNAGITRVIDRHGKPVVVFTNAASTKRENMTVRLSFDEGRTWPVARTLHAGPAAYSTVIGLRDGSLGVLYERGDANPCERITFARFTLDWVRSGR